MSDVDGAYAEWSKTMDERMREMVEDYSDRFGFDVVAGRSG